MLTIRFHFSQNAEANIKNLNLKIFRSTKTKGIAKIGHVYL